MSATSDEPGEMDERAQLTRLLGERMAIDGESLRDLARRRARVIRRQLIDVGQVAPERLFVLDVSLALDDPDAASIVSAESRVPTRLELTVH